jgi:hypothetical protein
VKKLERWQHVSAIVEGPLDKTRPLTTIGPTPNIAEPAWVVCVPVDQELAQFTSAGPLDYRSSLNS